MAKSTVETRTAEVIEAMLEYVKQPRACKVTRFNCISFAAGYSDRKAVNLQKIWEVVVDLFDNGAIDI